MKSELAGLVSDFRSADIDRRLDLSGMNKISRFAAGASSLALSDAGLKITRRNAEEFGISMGVCNGPPETAHMDSVFASDNYEPDITSFSNITANSTAGWVSNALVLKGANATFSPGPHAAVQAAAYAFDILSRGKGRCVLAGASDEVYDQTYYNYDLMNFLYRGSQERDYRIRWEYEKQKVLGEGAAMVALETMTSARERDADILAEVLGYATNQDCVPFGEAALSSEGLEQCCRRALQRSSISPEQIDTVFWAPQGNRQDRKVIDALKVLLGERAETVPLLTTTFNTGYIESASIFVTLACALEALKAGDTLWPQQTGIPEIDNRRLKQPPRHSLVCASSDIGYNFALALKHGT
jgi:3-oxoacyl-[acyl-carrier-protein] synthase II